MAYLVTKSLKSKGLGILLVLFLGPIGLFYASISGGIFMCLAAALALVLAIGSGSEGIFLLSLLSYPFYL